jgi:hypothetical protein
LVPNSFALKLMALFAEKFGSKVVEKFLTLSVMKFL